MFLQSVSSSCSAWLCIFLCEQINRMIQARAVRLKQQVCFRSNWHEIKLLTSHACVFKYAPAHLRRRRSVLFDFPLHFSLAVYHRKKLLCALFFV